MFSNLILFDLISPVPHTRQSHIRGMQVNILNPFAVPFEITLRENSKICLQSRISVFLRANLPKKLSRLKKFVYFSLFRFHIEIIREGQITLLDMVHCNILR